jgi:TRAP transporter TAXI family solute receptor
MKRAILLLSVIALTGLFMRSYAQITILSGFQGATYYEMSKDLEKIAPPVLTAKQAPNTIKVPDPNDPSVEIDSVYYTTTYDTVPFITVLSSDGAYYNFLKLEKTDVDVTFLQYDVLLYEEMKDLTRKFKKTENIRILLSLGSEQIHLIARKDSKIAKLSDLKGKQVGIGSAMQGTNITAKFIKEKTKIAWKDVEIPYDRAFRALLVGEIEAFFFVGAAPVSSLNKLSPNLKDQIKMIPVEHKELDAVYEKTTISSSVYSWIDKDMPTYNIKTVMVCSTTGETPEKANNIDKFLQTIKNNLSTLQDPKKAHPQWKNVNFGTDGIEWEFHPMAKKYMQ